MAGSRLRVLERAAKPVTGISAAAFATFSAIRRKRVFHPIGRAFSGRLMLEAGAATWLPSALTDAPEHDIVVRMSRGGGLPQALPDVLGLAFKIRGAYGEGRDQDFLLATSGADAVTRHMLIPALSFLARPYSSVLPYRIDRGLVTFAAFPVRAGEAARTFADVERLAAKKILRFEFKAAREGKSYERIGTIEVTAPLLEDMTDLRFNPWNTGPELQPAGALNELRRDSYVASQKARPN